MSREIWTSGLWKDNPALVKLLGLCPLLAVSNSTINAIALGLATFITLVTTNTFVSATRSYLHPAIRIPIYVLIIASTVSAIELMIQAWLPALHAALGIFLPLIVTNCLIIGRAESFASRQSMSASIIDAAAMGFGFFWVLVCLGALRELIGQGTLLADASILFGSQAAGWSMQFFNQDHAMLLAVLPPGAFIALGCMLAAKNFLDQKLESKLLNPSNDPSLNI